MNSRKLVFYSRRDLLPPGAVVLTPRDFKKTLHRFERGALPSLYVPVNLMSGWRTKLTPDEVAVEFLGPFTASQQEQASARLSLAAKVA